MCILQSTGSECSVQASKNSWLNKNGACLLKNVSASGSYRYSAPRRFAYRIIHSILCINLYLSLFSILFSGSLVTCKASPAKTLTGVVRVIHCQEKKVEPRTKRSASFLFAVYSRLRHVNFTSCDSRRNRKTNIITAIIPRVILL